MKKKIDLLFIIISFIIKFIVSLVVTNMVYSLLYCFSFALILFFLKNRNSKVINYLAYVMSDFIVGFYFVYEMYGFSVFSIIFNIVYFIFSNGFLYFILINYLGKYTSNKQVKLRVEEELDKGLRALENDQFDAAINSFSKVIKEHRTNYLGYMGMCNTLTKMDKKNLKKIKYYKKKCIKYAPRHLKESIDNKY